MQLFIKLIQTSLKLMLDQSFSSILQFVAIKRGDTEEWALPGGMVDPGEKFATTAIREFQEEAMNSLEASQGVFCIYLIENHFRTSFTINMN